jgi:Flp pilus assembly pilin Flp
MVRALRRFWKDEIAQDLIEYSLLIAFIALAIVQLIISGSKSVNGVWSTTNTTLTRANTAISGS